MSVLPSLSPIEGVRLRLRLIEPGDASYVFALRTNPAYNRHLSPVTGTVEDQRRWIEAYKEKEISGQELYYVIERRDALQRCGLVRLYEIREDRFTWGSWMLDGTKPSKAALESAVISLGVGFEILDKDLALIDVRKENTHAIAFYKRFGMRQVGTNSISHFFEYTASQFRSDRPRYMTILEKNGSR